MNRVNLIRSLGIIWTILYSALIVWLYAAQPATFRELTTQASVAVGAYQINDQGFNSALELFRREQFAAARSEFNRADPARRDARTQFYIAYSLYREGWGRVRSDKNLMQQALDAVNLAITLAPNNELKVDDPNLQLHTTVELKAEIERELARTISDYNPLKILERERK
jgi:LPS O-antigen subunit length determinant protein (WzzB/FepE family)